MIDANHIKPGFNPVFQTYGLPSNTILGSNSEGSHLSSIERPVHHEAWDKARASGYTVPSHMINEPPQGEFKIIIIGAGASGIDFLHHAPRMLAGLGVKLRCYEKNPDIGGTWYENRYPGCACDVPSVSYSFPWKTNPRWNNFYSSAGDIFQYLKDIVEEEDMMQYIQLNTHFEGATWSEESSQWSIRLSQGIGESRKEWEEACHMLLNGTGVLNAWKWPDIEGLHTFQGDLFHTGNYKEGYDLTGKRVAVIGSGSSGVQVCASIYPDVEKLYTWVRSPTWITAAFGQQFAGKNGQNFDYTSEQKQCFEKDPEQHQRYRKMIEHELNKKFKLVLRDTHESDEANAAAYTDMFRKLQSKPELRDVLIPTTFNVGCRRPTPGNGYLESLVGEKTTVLTTGIKCVTERGIMTETGEELQVDTIICATGFDTTFRPRFPIYGLDSKTSLAEKWMDFPSSYLGIAVDSFPNYFTYLGPFTPVAQGSLLPIITATTRYILQVIKKMRLQHIRRLSPKPETVVDFVEHCRTYLQRTCWADPCTSWFKQGTKDGSPVMWPGSRLSYFEVFRRPDFEDYEIAYWSGNHWGYMGNGFVDYEFTGTKDITWYLDALSGEPERPLSDTVYHPDPDEFRDLSVGALPGSKCLGRPEDAAPEEVLEAGPNLVPR